MSKMLEAQCVAGVVTAGIIPVPAADILSAGIGPSTGVLLLDEDKAKYITSNASDIKTALDAVATALTQIAAALTILDVKPLGALPPAPAAAANITAILVVQAQITVLKELLK